VGNDLILRHYSYCDIDAAHNPGRLSIPHLPSRGEP
jgi:hypothetical protein